MMGVTYYQLYILTEYLDNDLAYVSIKWFPSLCSSGRLDDVSTLSVTNSLTYLLYLVKLLEI